jgi:hypothetical protein
MRGSVASRISTGPRCGARLGGTHRGDRLPSACCRRAAFAASDIPRRLYLEPHLARRDRTTGGMEAPLCHISSARPGAALRKARS